MFFVQVSIELCSSCTAAACRGFSGASPFCDETAITIAYSILDNGHFCHLALNHNPRKAIWMPQASGLRVMSDDFTF